VDNPEITCSVTNKEPSVLVQKIRPQSYWHPHPYHQIVCPNWIDSQHAVIIDTLDALNIAEVLVDMILLFTGFDAIGALAHNLYCLWTNRSLCSECAPTVSVQLDSRLRGGCDGDKTRWLILFHRLDARTEKMFMDIMLCRSEYYGLRRENKGIVVGQSTEIFLANIRRDFPKSVVALGRILKLDQDNVDDLKERVVANSIVQVCTKKLVKACTTMDVDVRATIGKKRSYQSMLKQ
jgi:hypothetical protein